MKIYETKIDPFNLEEIDRQRVISKLNVFEQVLIHFTRFMLQDRWTRYALSIYLLIVHILALGYFIKVLNPSLVEEIDMLKSKWSAETLSAVMENEHPDVRF